MSSSPIRVALIGLSKNASASWAARAHLPYLLSPRGQEKYLIVALLNRSVDSAKAAIKAFNLPSSVKAYGSPDDLAKDPDVDLVVACTRVDTHYETSIPSLQAGKNVFIEWPVAQNADKAKELAKIAKTQHVRSIVDIQGRKSAVALKLREIIEKGSIGKVLNVEARIASPGSKRDAVPGTLDYFARKEVGGNPITIAFAHTLDPVFDIVGRPQHIQSNSQIRRPIKKVGDREVQSDVPDFVSFSGNLPSSPHVADGAIFSSTFRASPLFPSEPAYTLYIDGTLGEIKITTNPVSFWTFAEEVTIKVHDYATDQVETVAWEWEDWQKDLPPPARATGALYEIYASGKEVDEGVLGLEDAVGLHEIVDRFVGNA